MGRRARLRVGVAGVLAAACLFVVVVVPPAVFLARREAWLAALDRPAARADWEAFRAEMRRQSGPAGPVQHKVPKSEEPPLVVWLRDHAWLAVAAWVALGGTLGGVIAAMVIGAARPAPAGSAAGLPPEDQPTRDRHGDEQHQRDSQHTEK